MEDKKPDAAQSPALPGPMVGNDPYKIPGSTVPTRAAAKHPTPTETT